MSLQARYNEIVVLTNISYISYISYTDYYKENENI